MDLEKEYDVINMEALRQMLRMYDMNGKLLIGVKRMHINSGVRQGCIMSLWLFNVYVESMMKEVKIRMGKIGVRFLKESREWRCGGLEENLKVMLGCFVEVCRRRGLKDNAGKSKVMLLGGEEGLVCEVIVNELRLEDVSKFKYSGICYE